MAASKRRSAMSAIAIVSRLRRALVLGIAGTLLPVWAMAADPGPSQLIDTVARQVLKELDAHRDEMRKDPKKIRKLVDETLLPHFDTEYSARQVLGQNWRKATPEQRTRF